MSVSHSQINKTQHLFWPNIQMTKGLLLCLVIAVISYLSNLFIYNRISALLWAFIFSIVITNLFPLSAGVMTGVNYASSQLLRFSIAIFGFTVSALAWMQVGWVGLVEVLIVITFALLFGIYFGRAMGLSDSMSALIAVGTGICGASAIAAVGPSIEAKEEEMGMAVACITLFGLVAMFLYPILFQSTMVGNWLHQSEIAFGVWAGTGIHETAQVVGGASQISQQAMGIALAAKSVRIFAIAPVVVIFSAVFARRKNEKSSQKVSVPFFAIFFVIATLFNSLLLYIPGTSESWGAFSSTHLKPIVSFLLAVAFAGVGAKVRFKNFASLGYKAFLTGLVTALLTSVLALLLVLLVYIPAYHI